MLIGVYTDQGTLIDRNPKRANELVAAAFLQGHSVIIFEDSGVDIENRTIEGYQRHNGEWEKVITRPPDCIINPYPKTARGIKEMEKVFKAHFPVSTNLIGGKIQQYGIVSRSAEYRKHVLPFCSAKDFNRVKGFLQQHRDVVFKPSGAQRGRGIFFLRQEREHYVVHGGEGTENLSEDKLRRFLEGVGHSNYVIQKYSNCVTKEGLPYDFRLCVQKNGQGEWVHYLQYARMSPGKTTKITNRYLGGKFSFLPYILADQFGEEGEELEQKLKDTAIGIAKHIEKAYPFELDDLGVDLAIDQDRNIWFYEVNTGPDVIMETWARAQNSVGYAVYQAKKFKTRLRDRYRDSADKLIQSLAFIHTNMDQAGKESMVSLSSKILDGFVNLRQLCSFADEDLEGQADKGELAETYLVTLAEQWDEHDTDTMKDFIGNYVLPAVIEWKNGLIEYIESWEMTKDNLSEEQDVIQADA